MTDSTEVLLRQVPFVQSKGGQPTSPAFRPSTDDHGALSTRREYIGPQRAYDEYNALEGCDSIGTYGLSVGELQDEKLRSFDDGHLPENPEGHTSVYFDPEVRGKALVRLSKKLKELAEQRGRLYPL